MKKIKIYTSTICLLIGITSQAFASNTSTNFESNATLNSTCEISTANINFGNFIPSSTGSVDIVGNINTLCSKGISYTIGITSGISGNHGNRYMVGSNGNTDKLNYSLKFISGLTYVNWGESTSIGDPDKVKSVLINDGTALTHTIYARIPSNQYIKPDVYSDNLTVIVTY